jgi:hypothetical protein
MTKLVIADNSVMTEGDDEYHNIPCPGCGNFILHLSDEPHTFGLTTALIPMRCDSCKKLWELTVMWDSLGVPHLGWAVGDETPKPELVRLNRHHEARKMEPWLSHDRKEEIEEMAVIGRDRDITINAKELLSLIDELTFTKDMLFSEFRRGKPDLD